MRAPTEWQTTEHPSVPGYFCLRRCPHVGSVEYFGNRMGDEPKIEAFATRDQAERVGEYSKGRRGCIVDDLDLDSLDSP